ncbi:uncharacterized protein LOC141646276 [Silene latifolia]|uniref:uncharacterized protein LOC141646276 n=1 Tax=Silene latifolia TaxID=37657 RepID=UPI003D78A9FA
MYNRKLYNLLCNLFIPEILEDGVTREGDPLKTVLLRDACQNQTCYFITMNPSNATTSITIESCHNVFDDVCFNNDFDTTRELHFGIGSDGNLNFITSSRPPTTTTRSLVSRSQEDRLIKSIGSLSLEEKDAETSGSSSNQALASKGKKFKKKGKKGKNFKQVEDECHYCYGMGHWLRNCLVYLRNIREGIIVPKGFKRREEV